MCTQRKALDTNLPLLIRSGPRTNCNCSVRCMSAGGQTQGYSTNILPRARYSPCSKGSLWGEWLSSANWRQYRNYPLDLLWLD